MADIVACTNQIPIKVRFEIAINIPSVNQLVLIAEKQISVRILVDSLYILVKQIGLEHIVMIEEGDEIPCRGLYPCIGIERDAEVLFEIDNFHSAVSCHCSFNGSTQLDIFGTRVD